MTAGNLACGFTAIGFIFEGMRASTAASGGEPVDAETVGVVMDSARYFKFAIFAILGAFLFDALDGRMARIKGQESMFGREFDSLADIVSFGVAPALLVLDIVMGVFNNALGWIVAFMYLLCGGMRLARFNCLTHEENEGRLAPDHRDFVGFPIPAAAGLIASITSFLLWMNEGDKEIGAWRYVLLALMVGLSMMMLSEFRYPSFKKVDWRSRRSLVGVFVAIMVCVLAVLYRQVVPMCLFLTYLGYGIARPWVSKKWQRKIEEGPYGDDEEEEVDEDPGDPDESVA